MLSRQRSVAGRKLKRAHPTAAGLINNRSRMWPTAPSCVPVFAESLLGLPASCFSALTDSITASFPEYLNCSGRCWLAISELQDCNQLNRHGPCRPGVAHVKGPEVRGCC